MSPEEAEEMAEWIKAGGMHALGTKQARGEE
jgi:hypothetical protein